MRILFVCSGNICRSPLGAQLLIKQLELNASANVIESAGTVADDGAAMDVAAAAQSVRLGGKPLAHRSRYLTEKIASSADLVLTAERSHRAAVVKLAPRAAKRAFTIKQFARILNGLKGGDLVGVSTLNELVERVARLRGVIPPPIDVICDDITDPYRRSEATQQRVADEIDAAVRVIASALRGLN